MRHFWVIFKHCASASLLVLLYKSHFLYKCSIAKILEAGLMTRWRQVYWLPDDACSVPDGIGSGSPSVTVTDMQGSFMILGIGNYWYSEVWLYYWLLCYFSSYFLFLTFNAVTRFLHITFPLCILFLVFHFKVQKQNVFSSVRNSVGTGRNGLTSTYKNTLLHLPSSLLK